MTSPNFPVFGPWLRRGLLSTAATSIALIAGGAALPATGPGAPTIAISAGVNPTLLEFERSGCLTVNVAAMARA